MKIVLFVGLPASGKTTLAEQYQSKMGGYLLDDPRRPADLKQVPENTGLLLITDPSLCRTENRLAAEKLLAQEFGETEIEWIFFKNDPQACHKNAATRINKPVHRLIDILTAVYQPPNDRVLVDVYSAPQEISSPEAERDQDCDLDQSFRN